MATTPQWKTRRLAQRARRVVARRSAEHPAIKAYQSTLVPAATEFISAYDAVGRFQTKWKKELREGRGAVANLISTLRNWLPRLGGDLPEFDTSTFADTEVPDDVIEDATRLREAIEDHQELAANPDNKLQSLPYAEDLFNDLDPAFSAANTEWREAEEADSAYQKALRRSREAAANVQSELVRFRATLANVIGRSDTDYQKLRAARAATPDPDDDAPPPQ